MRVLSILASLVLVFSAPSLAQTVQGTVIDETGHSVPGVTAQIRIGDVARKAVTDEAGRFKFDRLRTGSGYIKFQLQGFETLFKELEVEDPELSLLAVMKLDAGVVNPTTFCDLGGDPAGDRPEKVRARSEHVFGVLETPSGPLAAAEVYLFPCADPEREACRTVTLADGSFAFSAPVPAEAEQTQITAVSSGYWSPWVETPPEGGKLHLKAHPMPAPGEVSCLSCD